jgi:hypothetical protein
MPEPQIANSLLEATSSFPSDKNNFGPRIGATYDISGHGSTIVRGGYGLFYGRIINSTISNAITNVGSASGQISLQLQTTSAGAPSFPNVLASASATPVRPDVVVFADDMQNPMVHEWDAIVEQRLGASTMLSASYVGSAGRNLPLFIDANLPQPSGTVSYAAIGGPFDGQTITTPIFTGARPDANFGASRRFHPWSTRVQRSRMLQVNRRLNKGLQFRPGSPSARARPTTARARRPSPRPTTC